MITGFGIIKFLFSFVSLVSANRNRYFSEDAMGIDFDNNMPFVFEDIVQNGEDFAFENDLNSLELQDRHIIPDPYKRCSNLFKSMSVAQMKVTKVQYSKKCITNLYEVLALGNQKCGPKGKHCKYKGKFYPAGTKINKFCICHKSGRVSCINPPENCPGNQVYQECKRCFTKCPAFGKTVCTLACMPGCGCPSKQPYSHPTINGSCLSLQQCQLLKTCKHEGKYYPIGTKIDTLCSCKKSGQIVCT